MKPYAHLKNRPLVYSILNAVNGKLYIGKSKCIYQRCNQYLYDFKERRLNHINDYLYNSMIKYGIENFDMIPLEFCNLELAEERELYWIITLQTNNRLYGYNLRLDSSTGMITAPETSEKIRQNLRQQWIDGKRKDHGDKLKANWANNSKRKKDMGQYFTKLLTKYEYIIELNGAIIEICNFKRLKELKLESAMSSFHRHKTDIIMLKGYRIVRKPLI